MAGLDPAVSIFIMSRFHSYINTALKIRGSYAGDLPFAQYLKQFFAANKKYGGSDRRQIASLCYNYFRLGFAASALPEEEKMLLASFLCEQESSPLMEKLKPEWAVDIAKPLQHKLKIVREYFLTLDIFPFKDELSDTVNAADFCLSFLLKPDLFIRIRPHTRLTTMRKLERSKLSYQMFGDDCVQLPQSINVGDYFIIDKEVVIQDRNSQQVLDYLKDESVQNVLVKNDVKTLITAWDCCAASGGKSILLNDILQKKLDLTISDIRASIISNLHLRFIKAGIKEYKYFISDISQADFTPVSSNFHLIICDAPCSGSGTWSRTPEQLGFFRKESIAYYSNLQKKIATHSMEHLRSEGLFVYITCSVFREENEMVSDFICREMGCELIEQKLLTGYDMKADSMFVAILKKN